MPLDPELSLDVVGGGGPHAPALPMGLGGQLGQILPLVNTLNQQRMFQQEFNARQQAGAIIAAAPDLDTGMQNLAQNPQVMGFAPQIFNEVRQGQLALTQLRGAQMTQAHTAWDAMMKAAIGSIDEPGQLTPRMNQQLSLLPPEIRASVMPAAKDFVTSLTSGMSDDPAQADANRAIYNKRLIGMALGSGVSPANAFAAAGAVPPQFVQGPFGVGNTTIGGVVGGLGGGGAGGINPLVASPLSPSQESMAKTQGDVFADQGLKEFQGAQNAQGAVARMAADVDRLAQGGGFQVPGTLGGARNQFARGVNTLATAFGVAPPFDPSKVATGESLQKETRTMGMQLITQNFGASRESWMAINNATNSVPGIENTTLGARLILENINQTAQHAIDLRNFQTNEWLPTHKTLIGSVEAFNNAHPPVDYAKQGLEKFGLNLKGFVSPQAVGESLQRGYITPDEAHRILKDQFHYGD